MVAISVIVVFKSLFPLIVVRHCLFNIVFFHALSSYIHFHLSSLLCLVPITTGKDKCMWQSKSVCNNTSTHLKYPPVLWLCTLHGSRHNQQKTWAHCTQHKCNSKTSCYTSQSHQHKNLALFPGLHHHPLFDSVQYGKMEGEAWEIMSCAVMWCDVMV